MQITLQQFEQIEVAPHSALAGFFAIYIDNLCLASALPAAEVDGFIAALAEQAA